MSKYYSLETLIEASRNTYCDMNDLETFLSEIPAEKSVEITRCKDCIYSRPLCYTEKKLYNEDCVGCTKNSTSYYSFIMNENDFCSYAESKENERE